MANKKISKVVLKNALLECGGNISNASKITGISRNTFYSYLEDHPEMLYTAKLAWRKEAKKIESLFLETMQERRDLKSMQWYLEKKGRHLGYGEPILNEPKEDAPKNVTSEDLSKMSLDEKVKHIMGLAS